MNINLPEDVISGIIEDWFQANIRGGDELTDGDDFLINDLLDQIEIASHAGVNA